MPDPVPPQTTMLRRSRTASRSSRGDVGREQNAARGIASAPNRRMVMQGPSTANGGTTALTREPSGKRASTNGEERSTRRPSGPTTFSMR